MSESSKRRNYFIDKSFQTRFIIQFCSITIISSVLTIALLFWLSEGSNTVAIENTHVIVKTTADFMLPLTIQTIVIVFLLSSIGLIFLTLLFSHKISGPLYRLTQEINRLEQGDLTTRFQVRGTDQLQKFSEKLFEMCAGLRTRYTRLKQQHLQLKRLLEEKHFVLSDEEKKKVRELLSDIEEQLNYYKTS
jgi:signal transduction histidine kinase